MTCETPFPAMTEITGHLAFYPDKVKIEEVMLAWFQEMNGSAGRG
jgi:uncharacterized protein (DUF427 family)